MLKRDIQKTLTQSVVNPRTDLEWKFVVDLNDPNYCITRAQEILIKSPVKDKDLEKAITLLAIARTQRNGGNYT